MKIAIFGSGGVGGYFGGRLAAAGEDVTFLARGAHLNALQHDGLHIESPLGDVAPAEGAGHRSPAGDRPGRRRAVHRQAVRRRCVRRHARAADRPRHRRDHAAERRRRDGHGREACRRCARRRRRGLHRRRDRQARAHPPHHRAAAGVRRARRPPIGSPGRVRGGGHSRRLPGEGQRRRPGRPVDEVRAARDVERHDHGDALADGRGARHAGDVRADGRGDRGSDRRRHGPRREPAGRPDGHARWR